MDRRRFLLTSLAGALAAPLAAEAQPAGRVIKIGILSTVNPRTTTFFEAMVQRRHELGAADQVRTHRQSEDRQGARPHDPAFAAASGGPGHR